jgi:transcriptional regulator with XRE-family HTH domain
MRVASDNLFKDRLRELREQVGLSMYALAKKSKISKQALSKLERGESEPTWATVLKLAHALGVPLTAFDVDIPSEEPPATEEEEPPAPKRRPKK